MQYEEQRAEGREEEVGSHPNFEPLTLNFFEE